MKEISKAFSTNLRERLKGLALGFQGAVAGYLYNIANQPNFDFVSALTNWQPLVNGALLAGGLYLLHTFVSGSKKAE